MKAEVLKERLREALWAVVDRHDVVLSATLTGSFVDSPSLEGISDIDFVLVVDPINRTVYNTLLADFDTTLTPILREAGYRLHINPTLGPLKFNEPDLAVLHLMLYSRRGHIDHVIQSPFTCLDWQRSAHYRKRSLADIYPVFGLQPRHFLGARRSLSDYLRDFRANTVSYRELICDERGYREQKHGKPMTMRDRHEFAYHVIRFLIRNLLKLVRRTHEVPQGTAWLDAFFAIFPENEATIRPFFEALSAKKRALDFREPIMDLDHQLESFFETFEHQFRRAFIDDATRHTVLRHAETHGNRSPDGQVRFLGRTDLSIAPQAARVWDTLADHLATVHYEVVYSSPMFRCIETLTKLGFPPHACDARLREIEYGDTEGLTVNEARSRFPELFQAWHRGEDTPFPNGENTATVVERVQSFIDQHWTTATGPTLTCSHNVVLRCLIGSTLGVPMNQWFRIQVPHLAPVTFIQTRQFGRFVDLDESTEATLFQSFAAQAG